MQPAAASGKHFPSLPACGSIQLSEVPANRLQGLGKQSPCSQHHLSISQLPGITPTAWSQLLAAMATTIATCWLAQSLQLCSLQCTRPHCIACAEPAACGISVLQDPSDGMSALMKAADGGHAEALVTLLQAGCPWNLQDHEGYTAGATPLIDLVSCSVKLGAQRYAICSP